MMKLQSHQIISCNVSQFYGGKSIFHQTHSLQICLAIFKLKINFVFIISVETIHVIATLQMLRGLKGIFSEIRLAQTMSSQKYRTSVYQWS